MNITVHKRIDTSPLDAGGQPEELVLPVLCHVSVKWLFSSQSLPTPQFLALFQACATGEQRIDG